MLNVHNEPARPRRASLSQISDFSTSTLTTECNGRRHAAVRAPTSKESQQRDTAALAPLTETGSFAAATSRLTSAATGCDRDARAAALRRQTSHGKGKRLYSFPEAISR